MAEEYDDTGDGTRWRLEFSAYLVSAKSDPWIKERVEWIQAEIDYARDGKDLFAKYTRRFSAVGE